MPVTPSHSRIVCVVAPNPSPLTLEGTNSYLIFGDGEALAIDPGPHEPAHIEALLAAAAARKCRIAAIAVTHGHADHFPGAALLRERTGAPVYAHPAVRFPRDHVVRDGERIAVRGAAVVAYDTPGHTSDHLVFWFPAEAALFAGDVILGRGTALVAPPEGDMRAYQATLRRLRALFASARTIYGGHGAPVHEPLAKIDAYIAHREMRERQLLAALSSRARTIAALTREIYRDVDPQLHAAAAQQVLAYLIALERDGRVRVSVGSEPASAAYALVEE